MTPPLLAFQALQVRSGPVTLLDIPSFCLDAGERVALIGPNGSGKTTFLHTAAFLRPAAAGHISFAGQVVGSHTAASVRRRISVVFQDPLLFNVNVLRNAAAGLRFHGLPRAQAERRATELLDLFGIAHLARRAPCGLSGGEAARVALARAFATDPDLLLLDEPFSALDAASRTVLLPELRERLQERGAAAILVTHDLAEAFAFAPRLLLLDSGRVIADGDSRILATRPPSRRAAVLIGVDNVLSGRVTAFRQGFGSVEIAPGAHILAACDAVRPVGTPVEVTVPAGMIHLIPAGDNVPIGWNALSARVESVTSLPGWDLTTLRTSGPCLQARRAWGSGGPHEFAGDQVTAAFPPDAAWIIPEGPPG